jgi:hypothetical protein
LVSRCCEKCVLDIFTLRRLSQGLVVLVFASHLLTFGGTFRLCSAVDISTYFFSIIVGSAPGCGGKALFKLDPEIDTSPADLGRVLRSGTVSRATSSGSNCSEADDILLLRFNADVSIETWSWRDSSEVA